MRTNEHRASEAPGEDTRTRILAVTQTLMAQHGFAATSTREVCEQMGFTKAALYYHFRSKDELLSELVEPLLVDLRALMPADHAGDAAASPATRRDLLIAYVDLVSRHTDLIRLLMEDPSVRRQPALTEAQATSTALITALSGTTDPIARARARGALGAVSAVLVRADPGDDHEVLRAAAVAAGCGALGVPTP